MSTCRTVHRKKRSDWPTNRCVRHAIIVAVKVKCLKFLSGSSFRQKMLDAFFKPSFLKLLTISVATCCCGSNAFHVY